MLEVKRIERVELRTDGGKVLQEGDRVIYHDKSNRDLLAIFRGFEKGLVIFENVTNDVMYNVRASSIEYIKVDETTEQLRMEGVQ